MRYAGNVLMAHDTRNHGHKHTHTWPARSNAGVIEEAQIIWLVPCHRSTSRSAKVKIVYLELLSKDSTR